MTRATISAGRGTSAPVLGLRENLRHFSLLVVVNACVPAMAGMERSLLPALLAFR